MLLTFKEPSKNILSKKNCSLLDYRDGAIIKVSASQSADLGLFPLWSHTKDFINDLHKSSVWRRATAIIWSCSVVIKIGSGPKNLLQLISVEKQLNISFYFHPTATCQLSTCRHWSILILILNYVPTGAQQSFVREGITATVIFLYQS